MHGWLRAQVEEGGDQREEEWGASIWGGISFLSQF